MKNRTVDFLGIPLSKLTMDQTVNYIDDKISKNKLLHHCVINAGKVVLMKNSKKLYNDVVSSDLINPDGIAIVYAAKFLGLKIKERVTGIDLMYNLLKLSEKKGYGCYFLGAKDIVLEKMIKNFKEEFPDLIISGYNNGYFNKKSYSNISKKIIKTNAQLLFVGISSPKKEDFLNSQKQNLKSLNLIMGVGGSFDIYSGLIKRAPKIFQNFGMEWFFRLISEPRRMWKRYLLGNFKFILIIFKERFLK